MYSITQALTLTLIVFQQGYSVYWNIEILTKIGDKKPMTYRKKR